VRRWRIEPATAESSCPIVSTVRHAGVVKVKRYGVDMDVSPKKMSHRSWRGWSGDRRRVRAAGPKMIASTLMKTLF
jgi:hypothetical protein